MLHFLLQFALYFRTHTMQLANPLLLVLGKCLGPLVISKPKQQLYIFGLGLFVSIAGYSIWQEKHEFYWKVLGILALSLISMFDATITMRGNGKSRNYSLGMLLFLLTFYQFRRFQLFCYCLFVISYISKAKVMLLLWLLAEVSFLLLPAIPL
eukprot:TRINITY_DN4688_c0_g1_i2.p2 TRINITY_DN4688_c0_g1~~TRINITY_DN4688_c0_g1_i2.p2  ORF type:complete len:153 (-),score=18.09 TRINITY_DN4688_c0_g1_i2:644-1102(-)